MTARYGSGGVLYHAATGQVLLQHRTDDAPHYPGQWGLFGGGEELEDKGDPIVTWHRELREELGVEIERTAITALGVGPGQGGGKHYFFAYPWPAPTRDFVLGEGQGFAWFAIEAALGLSLLTPLAADCIMRARAMLEGVASSGT